MFYDEFGALMMRQPLLGVGFTTYAPIALLPYMVCRPFRPVIFLVHPCWLPIIYCELRYSSSTAIVEMRYARCLVM